MKYAFFCGYSPKKGIKKSLIFDQAFRFQKIACAFLCNFDHLDRFGFCFFLFRNIDS